MECGACLLDIGDLLAAKHRFCGKFFHVECLNKWESQEPDIEGDPWNVPLSNQHLCPQCRQTIGDNVDYEEVPLGADMVVDEASRNDDNHDHEADNNDQEEDVMLLGEEQVVSLDDHDVVVLDDEDVVVLDDEDVVVLDDLENVVDLNNENMLVLHRDDHQDRDGPQVSPATGLGSPVYLGQQLPPANAYTCGVCGRPNFNNTSSKSQHTETHAEPGERTCPRCRDVFCNRTTMLRHLRNLH